MGGEIGKDGDKNGAGEKEEGVGAGENEGENEGSDVGVEEKDAGDRGGEIDDVFDSQ
ncbi:hypothetical protein FACS189472_18900 [Alphaproteobacteria bacterium]|nr:hypothetical protein FACS189472_18900 [Alphaproteobacteria bacterium]